MDYRLTDEEAKNISIDVLGLDLVALTGNNNPSLAYKIGKIQQETVDAQIAKLQKYYADMGSGELKYSISDVICGNCPLLDVCQHRKDDQLPPCNDLQSTIDQILSLVMGYMVEKVKGIDTNIPQHSRGIGCPHCGEEFGIEDMAEAERIEIIQSVLKVMEVKE